jgi:hypothetical protein
MESSNVIHLLFEKTEIGERNQNQREKQPGKVVQMFPRATTVAQEKVTENVVKSENRPRRRTGEEIFGLY